jgi:hypothetical protein
MKKYVALVFVSLSAFACQKKSVSEVKRDSLSDLNIKAPDIIHLDGHSQRGFLALGTRSIQVKLQKGEGQWLLRDFYMSESDGMGPGSGPDFDDVTAVKYDAASNTMFILVQNRREISVDLSRNIISYREGNSAFKPLGTRLFTNTLAEYSAKDNHISHKNVNLAWVSGHSTPIEVLLDKPSVIAAKVPELISLSSFSHRGFLGAGGRNIDLVLQKKLNHWLLRDFYMSESDGMVSTYSAEFAQVTGVRHDAKANVFAIFIENKREVIIDLGRNVISVRYDHSAPKPVETQLSTLTFEGYSAISNYKSHENVNLAWVDGHSTPVEVPLRD